MTDLDATSAVQPRVALATFSGLPDLDPDDAPVLVALAERGVDARAAVWDDSAVDWSQFDLVVVRDTWDYTERHEEFLAWTRHVEDVSRLANPAGVIAWNSDKVYLRDFAAHGIAVVPTIWLNPGPEMNGRKIHTRFPAFGEFVIKPTVSAGSKDTARYRADDTDDRGKAVLHAKGLLQAGRSTMLQPYLTDVDVAGETTMVYIDGELSHVMRKGPLLTRFTAVSDQPYLEEDMATREPTEQERALADRVVAALGDVLAAAGHPVDEPLLYFRIDLLPGADGQPVLIELEATEPSLFLRFDAGAVDRFADAIVRRLGRA